MVNLMSAVADDDLMSAMADENLKMEDE